MWAVRFWLLLLVVCGLALALRVYRLDAQSLWYDEGISAHQVTRSFGEIAAAAGQDTHPPLYYWLLKLWAERFGQTEDGLRSLSVVFGVASVALTFAIGRRLFGLGAAFVAALIVACAPLAVYYSQEVRMYTQVLAFGLLASWAYLRRIHWLYALAGAATIYSHYLGFAFLAALNLHALLWWRRLDRRSWLFWLGANALIALLFLPWLPTFLQQSTGRALNTSPRTLGGLTLDTISGYGGGLTTGDLAVAGGALLVALAVIGLVLGLQRPSLRFGTSLALLLWLVPLGLVEVLGIREGLFELRYLVVSMPGPGAARRPGRGRAGYPARSAVRPKPRRVGHALAGGSGELHLAAAGRLDPDPGFGWAAAPVLRPVAGARRLPRRGPHHRAIGRGERRGRAGRAEPGRGVRLLLPRLAAGGAAAGAAADRPERHPRAARGAESRPRPAVARVLGDERGRPAQRDRLVAGAERLRGEPSVVRRRPARADHARQPAGAAAAGECDVRQRRDAGRLSAEHAPAGAGRFASRSR